MTLSRSATGHAGRPFASWVVVVLALIVAWLAH